jgi:hypothetical protein
MAPNIPPVDTHELAKLAFERVVTLEAQVGINKVNAQAARIEAKTELLGKYDDLGKEIKGLGKLVMHLLQSQHHPKWSERRRHRKLLKDWTREGIKIKEEKSVRIMEEDDGG